MAFQAEAIGTGAIDVADEENACTASLVETRADIIALEQDWRALEARCSGTTVFQSFGFCAHWLDLYAFGDEPTHAPRIVALRDRAGAVVALVPFAITLGDAFSIAEWIGEPLLQYGDVLIADDADRTALRRTLKHFKPLYAGMAGLHLRHIRDDARAHDILPLEGSEIGQAREAALADFTPFADFEAFTTEKWSNRARKNRRKKRRKLEEHGPLGFAVHQPGPDAAKAAAQAIAFKKDWLQQLGLTSRAFSDARALECLRRMAGDDTWDSGLVVSELRVGDTPCGIECAFADKQGLIAYIGAFDPALEELSPGKVQMEETVRYCFKTGIPRYDLLAPLAPYKEPWTTVTVPVRDYGLIVSSIGWLYMNIWLHHMRPRMKALAHRAPPAMRRLMFKMAEEQEA